VTTYSAPAVTPSATRHRTAVVGPADPASSLATRTASTSRMTTPLTVVGHWNLATSRLFTARWPGQGGGTGPGPGGEVPTTGQIWPRGSKAGIQVQ
jgi:hypothetical protein